MTDLPQHCNFDYRDLSLITNIVNITRPTIKLYKTLTQTKLWLTQTAKSLDFLGMIL